RLHGARIVPDGPHHGRRRAARAGVHPAAVELRLRHPRHHGDAGDRQPARSLDHDPGGAADDLLGAHPGLHAHHLGLHPGHPDRRLDQPPGAGDVRPLRDRPRPRARRLPRRPTPFFGRHTPPRPFMLELPDSKLPSLRSVAIGLYTRAWMFLQRAGTTIFAMMVMIWFLASFPRPPAGAEGPAINYSLAAMIG